MRIKYTINAIRCEMFETCSSEFEGAAGEPLRELKQDAMRSGWLVGTSAAHGDYCSDSCRELGQTKQKDRS